MLLTIILQKTLISCRCFLPVIIVCRTLPIVLLACFSLLLGTAQAADRSEPQLSGVELMGQGKAAFHGGDFGTAVYSFDEAYQLFSQQMDANGQCQALTSLGQTNSFIGQHSKALEELEKAITLARSLKDRVLIAKALNALGNVHLAMGNEVIAEQNLQEALALAQEEDTALVAAASLNNLGNLYLAQQNDIKATSSYKEASFFAEQSGDESLAAQTLVNGARAAYRAGRYEESRHLLDQAEKHLADSDKSVTNAYTLINAGLLYADLGGKLLASRQDLVLAAVATYNNALKMTHELSDNRTASYAYGNLAKLYEDEAHYQEALDLTRLATFAAQQSNAPESLYQWHWQAGRILAELHNLDQAIASYRLAIHDLQSIREELSTCYASPDSSYQKTAAEITSELVDLLLQRASQLKTGENIETFLVEARDTLEILKIYELREYFRDDCLDAASTVKKKLDVVSEHAVVIYPVLLKDRVELLVSFSGNLKRYILPVQREVLDQEILAFRKALMKRTTWEFLPHAQQLYEWLIRPLEADLETVDVDTLVFVPDGLLRTVPISALHDGSQFLVSQYPIAVTPSLMLTDPQPVNRQTTRLLSLGITDPVQGFAGLPYVEDELAALNEMYDGISLLNDQFSLDNVEEKLKKESFSMVHIASHGQFGADVGNTFLLAYDEKFTMERIGQYVGLYRFREEPLDLIALSACETAAGDDRAALGLAGVAVRTGARSALATLWHVNDPASYKLVVEFYRNLNNPGMSRAAALQATQIELLQDMRYEHPGYWSPFLLINNWL